MARADRTNHSLSHARSIRARSAIRRSPPGAAHESPLGAALARGLDEIGAVATVQHTIDVRAVACVERFLRARDLPHVRAPRLTALLLVRAIDVLTHTAIEHDPSSLGGGVLVDELTALALGYLRTER